jgi:hypothetical protein
MISTQSLGIWQAYRKQFKEWELLVGITKKKKLRHRQWKHLCNTNNTTTTTTSRANNSRAYAKTFDPSYWIEFTSSNFIHDGSWQTTSFFTQKNQSALLTLPQIYLFLTTCRCFV